MNHGQNIEFLEELAEDDPANPPPALEKRPEVDEHLQAYLEGFQRLSRSRQIGFDGYQPLTIADVFAYAAVVRLCEPIQFLTFMQALDDVFMEWQNARRS